MNENGAVLLIVLLLCQIVFLGALLVSEALNGPQD